MVRFPQLSDCYWVIGGSSEAREASAAAATVRAEAIAAAAAAGTATSEEELEALAAVEAAALWRKTDRQF